MTRDEDYKKLAREVSEIAWQRQAASFKDKTHLNNLIERIATEIDKLEKASSKPVEPDEPIEAIWVLSGVGTYFTPITNTSGDQTYKDKTWAHWSDKKRLDKAGEIFLRLEKKPYLIYNGITAQNEALINASRRGFPIPLDKIYLPEGKIDRTIDQVKNLALPSELNQIKGYFAIISNAPHLSRTIRMFNRYQPLPNIKIKLLPIPAPSIEYARNEMVGTIDYIAKNQATKEPYPFEV